MKNIWLIIEGFLFGFELISKKYTAYLDKLSN